MKRKLTIFLLLTMLAGGCRNTGEADVKRVIKAMHSSDPAVRNQAALEAAGFGDAASKVVPELIRLLNDENRGVQSGAAYALRRIGTPEAERALARATKNNSADKKQ